MIRSSLHPTGFTEGGFSLNVLAPCLQVKTSLEVKNPMMNRAPGRGVQCGDRWALPTNPMRRALWPFQGVSQVCVLHDELPGRGGSCFLQVIPQVFISTSDKCSDVRMVSTEMVRHLVSLENPSQPRWVDMNNKIVVSWCWVQCSSACVSDKSSFHEICVGVA